MNIVAVPRYPENTPPTSNTCYAPLLSRQRYDNEHRSGPTLFQRHTGAPQARGCICLRRRIHSVATDDIEPRIISPVQAGTVKAEKLVSHTRKRPATHVRWKPVMCLLRSLGMILGAPSLLQASRCYKYPRVFRHYYKSIAKCAGKDYRDGAVVPFE